MASDPTILFVKPKAISDADKEALKSAGVIVVEIKNPKDVKFVRASTELSSTQIMTAAAKAISESAFTDVKETFARAICAAIMAEAESTPSPATAGKHIG